MVSDRIVVNKSGTHYFLDEAEVTEATYRKRYPAPADEPAAMGNRPWSRPLKSEALACHPDQIKEQMAEDAKRGLSVDYDEEGRPEFGGQAERRRYMQAYGYFDRDAGYGDAAPQHHKGKKAPPSRLLELAKRHAHRIRLHREGRR